jgi:hypothetical protein
MYVQESLILTDVASVEKEEKVGESSHRQDP